ncbi:hypothetical protein EG832_09090 [bacterium]|nr:hypothetical protein [bacterium]
MKTKRILIPSFALLISLALSACVGTATPLATLDTNHAATAVAGTMTAFVAPGSTATNTPHELPSATSTPETAGIRAVFVSANRNIYTWTPGESNFTQLTTSGDVDKALVSSDGSLIAFTRTTDFAAYSLSVMHADGSDQHALFTQEQFSALPRPEITLGTKPLQIAWVPNTHNLAMTFSYVIEGPGTSIGHDLMVINSEDGTYRSQLSVNDDWQFAYSPDGSKIVASLPDGINLYKSDGTVIATKFFSYQNVITASEYQYTPDVHWSQDGSQIAFTIPPVEPFSDPPDMTQVIKVKATDLSVTTPLKAQMVYMGVNEYSPDLSKIAYTKSVDTTTGAVDLHIAYLDGSGDELYLAKVDVNKFAWSPDNQHFIYSLNQDSKVSTYIGQVGSTGNKVNDVAALRQIIWLDANQYLILDKTTGGWKIWFGTIGSTPVAVYEDSSMDETPIDPLSMNQ